MSRVFSVCDCHGDWKIAEGKDQIYVSPNFAIFLVDRSTSLTFLRLFVPSTPNPPEPDAESVPQRSRKVLLKRGGLAYFSFYKSFTFVR